MELYNPFTESTLERLPGPASDPAIALARAAHLLLEILNHPLMVHGSPRWIMDIVRAHMERLDPTWNSKILTLGYQSTRSSMDHPRFQGELGALSEAALEGYRLLLGETFGRLAEVGEMMSRVPGNEAPAILAAVAAHRPLPEFLHEQGALLSRHLSQLSNPPPRDSVICSYIAEAGVLCDLWIRVDTAARRLLLRPRTSTNGYAKVRSRRGWRTQREGLASAHYARSQAPSGSCLLKSIASSKKCRFHRIQEVAFS